MYGYGRVSEGHREGVKVGERMTLLRPLHEVSRYTKATASCENFRRPCVMDDDGAVKTRSRKK